MNMNQSSSDKIDTRIQFRQGDVLLEAVAEIPGSARQRVPGSRIILAHGELTGHHHSVDAEAADWWKTPSGEQFIEVQRTTALEHPEHAPLTLPPGRYRVVRQREYVPASLTRPAGTQQVLD